MLKHIDELSELPVSELKEIFKKRFRGAVKNLATKKNGVMFSGGVDSTTISFIAKDYSDIVLITVGTKKSPDLLYAEKIAKELGLKWKKEIVTEEKLLDYFHEVKGILKEYLEKKDNKLMEIELGLIVFLCCKLAKEEGINTIFSGQGAEELFGGYERHLISFKKNKSETTKLLMKELCELDKTNLERNSLIAKYVDVNLAYPFLEKEVIEVAMAIPIEEKIDINGNKKIIFHEIAKEIGIPEIAYKRHKKAAQYGSGIHKMLIKMMKEGKIFI